MEKLLQQTLPNGQFEGLTAQRSQTMKVIRGKGNRSTEQKLRLALVRAGVRGWTLNAKAIYGCPDFYFPDCRLVVFVDGCFWHGCPKCGHIPKTNSRFWETKIHRTQTRDSTTSKRLRKSGYRVLRFWEHELKDDLGSCVKKIVAAVSSRETNM